MSRMRRYLTQLFSDTSDEISLGKTDFSGQRGNQYTDPEAPYYQQNVEPVRAFLQDLPENSEAYLNGEHVAGGREEIVDTFTNWFIPDPHNEYLVAQGEHDDEHGYLSVQVGDIDRVSVWNADLPGGDSRGTVIRNRSKLPTSPYDKIRSVDLDSPTYELRLEWDRTV